jgi:hypothetical protein
MFDSCRAHSTAIRVTSDQARLARERLRQTFRDAATAPVPLVAKAG